MKDPSLAVPGLDYQDFPEGLTKGNINYDGHVWGIPYSIGFGTLWYRKDLFEQANLQPPATVEDMMEAAKVLTKDVGGKKQYGMVLRGKAPAHDLFIFLTFFYTFGGRPFDDAGNPAFNSEAGVKALQYYMDLGKYMPVGWQSFDHADATNAIQQGDAAMDIEASQLIPWVEDPAKSKVAGKVGYLPVPKYDDVNVRGAGWLGWQLGISSTSKHPKEAMKFIEWVTSKRMARSFLVAGGYPQRFSILLDPELNKMPQYAWMKPVGEAAKIAPFTVPVYGRMSEVFDIVGRDISDSLIGKATAKESLDAANAEVAKLLAEK